MKLKTVTILLCAISLLAACEKEDSTEPQLPQPREMVARTVLVYLVGDNTAFDLSRLLMGNFEDMKIGMSQVDDADCNLVVYSEMKADVPHLIRIYKNKGKVIADTLYTYPEQNPLSKEVMGGVFSEMMRLFPADSYGMVFLSHGEGWVPGTTPKGRSMGDYRGTQMNIADFHQVLKKTRCHLDFLLFDDCYMQSVEVAFELRDCVDYFIGSPTEIPGPGGHYDLIVPSLFVKEEFAKEIANSYFDHYSKEYTGEQPTSNEHWTGGVSVSVIDSRALNVLAAVTKKVLPKYVTDQRDINSDQVLCYDKRSSRYYHDFDGLMRSLTQKNADYDTWKLAFDAAVIQWSTTPENYSAFAGMFSMSGSAGISTYIPRSYSLVLNDFYHSYEWYTASGWSLTGW